MEKELKRSSNSLIIILTVTLLSLFFAYPVSAALPDYVYLNINGDTSSSAMTQGDLFFWVSNCDSGAVINWEIWYDVNNNSTIEYGTDVLINSENIIDGSPLFEPNPVKDGWVISESFKLGAEPGAYIFKAKDVNSGVSAQRVMTVSAMSSPPNVVTGTITVPGYSAPDPFLANRFVFAESDIYPGAFIAATDDNGYYSINISDEGTGGNFYLNAPNVPGYIPPEGLVINVSGVMNNNDFTFTAATDSVWGYVKDNFGDVVNFEGEVRSEMFYPSFGQKNSPTLNGRYAVYFNSSEQGLWQIQPDNYKYFPAYLSGYPFVFDYNGTLSQNQDLILYKADTSIYVEITENGGLPNYNFPVQAYSDLLQTTTFGLSGTGSDNIVEIRVSSLDNSNWFISGNSFDSDYPLPIGYIPQSSFSGVSPGDTVNINFIIGKMVSSYINQDPGDPQADFNQMYIGMDNGGTYYNGQIDGSGMYTIYGDTGTYNISLYTPDYLVFPSFHELVLTGDTTGGLDFDINYAHCQVSGTLLNVPLPLNASYYGVFARTGTDYSDGYTAYTDVDSVTGTYTLNLCDGTWTIFPPCCFEGTTQPDSVILVIGEDPDNFRQQDFDYLNPGGCCEGMTGNADNSLDGGFDIADIIFLVDYMFNDGPAPYCPEEAEVNGDGGFDIADVIYLVDYIFNDGPPPLDCP